MEGKEIEKWAQQKIGKETIWCIDPYRLRWKQEIRNCAMLISMEIFFFYFSSIPPDPPPLERVGWSALSHRCSHIGPLLCPGILRLLERSWRLYHPATPPCPSPIIPYHTPTDLSEDGLISLRKLSLVSHFLFSVFIILSFHKTVSPPFCRPFATALPFPQDLLPALGLCLPHQRRIKGHKATGMEYKCS